MNINPLIQLKADAQHVGLEVILPKEIAYENRRQVVNQRFSYHPYAIALCKCAQDVKFCIDFCIKKNLKDKTTIKVRIRSGGHHHEGMSCADNVLLLDLSGMNKIEYNEKGNQEEAWIPPGKKLKDVYTELEKIGRIIPGGVCDFVNVGGFTQGVGWGSSTRKWGYGCDNIVAAQMVLANGEIVVADKDNYSDLFWAIRGGGGGNFGVVTKYRFKLRPLSPEMTKIVLTWDEKDTRKAVQKWAKFQLDLDADPNLTLGGRLFPKPKQQVRPTEPPKPAEQSVLIMGGIYYGSLEEARKAIASLLTAPRPIKVEYSTLRPPQPTSSDSLLERLETSVSPSDSISLALSELGDIINPSIPAFVPLSNDTLESYTAETSTPKIPSPPRKTCQGRHPNKVSSAFPVNCHPDTIHRLMDKVVDYIENEPYYPDLNNYVSLHGIGGQSQHEPVGRAAFPYRDRPFIFKFQAWWALSEDKQVDNHRAKTYVEWIQEFRKSLLPEINGAFTNFQDKTLVKDSHTLTGRLALLQEYYGDRLERLRTVKSNYDPDYFFDFGMSIPPLGVEKL